MSFGVLLGIVTLGVKMRSREEFNKRRMDFL